MTPSPASSHTEYLLGFTARPLPRDLDHEWPTDRRQLYLLNENAPEPISVDNMCGSKLPCIDPDTAARSGTTGLQCAAQLDPYLGPNQSCALSLWTSHETLIAFLTPHLGPPSQGRYALHAITVLATHPVYRSSFDASGFGGSDTASSLDSSWIRLGYDIADIWLLSGLSNCGYTPSDRPHAARFIRSLNRFHLFDDAAIALDFARFTDQRVDEHAPFHVFGMFQYQVR